MISKVKKTIIYLTYIAVILFVCACATKDLAEYEHSEKVSITVLGGEFYSVEGDSKLEVAKGGSASFVISLTRGYRIVGIFGDEKNCEYTNEVSFTQTLTVSNVYYNVSVRLLTEEMQTTEFNIISDEDAGVVELYSALGEVENCEGYYYSTDVIDLSATAKDGYRFSCWSIGDYLSNGGEFYSNYVNLSEFDFNRYSSLYANFKSALDTSNTIIYTLNDGAEIDQDCSALVAHHPRANTLTAVDLREQGIDCDSKMLVGWMTEEGNTVGLGSRVAVNSEHSIKLEAIWKSYTDSVYFEVSDDGSRIVKYNGEPNANGEVIVPREINGKMITVIADSAFSGCTLNSLYLPDSISTVEDNAFVNCTQLTDVYMSDNIVNISDKAFSGCKNLTTLHLNAYHKPRFNYQEIGQKTDLYDTLAMNADNGVRKIVVLGGSSVRYGYSTYKMREMFSEIYDDDFEIYNMGWNADYDPLAQFEVINAFLRDGDIFIHAPEQFKGSLMGNVATSPITNEPAAVLIGDYSLIYRIAETNYDFLTHMNIGNYANVFSMLATFNKNRLISAYPPRDYAEYFKDFVDDDSYGTRATTENVEPEGGVNKAYSSVHNFEDLEFYTACWNRLKDCIYSRIADGVNIFVAFPPINRCNLDMTYDSLDSMTAAANVYTELVKNVLADTDVTVLGNQLSTIYMGEHFTGHDYHLGAPFRDTHTENILNLLIQVLKAA